MSRQVLGKPIVLRSPEVADAGTAVLEEVNLEMEENVNKDDNEVDLEASDEEGKKEKRTRKTWAKSNQWFYPAPENTQLEVFKLKGEKDDKDATKAAMEKNPLPFQINQKIKNGEFKYEDGSVATIEQLRPFRITGPNCKYVVEDGVETDEVLEGKPVGFVVATSNSHAAELFLKQLGYDIDIHFKQKRGGGRGKTKIEANLLNYGKMLAFFLFGKDGVVQDGMNPATQTKIVSLTNYPATADAGQLADWKRTFAAGGEFGHYINHDTGEWKQPTE